MLKTLRQDGPGTPQYIGLFTLQICPDLRGSKFVIKGQKYPGLTCGLTYTVVKPRFLFKTVDLWSYINA